MDFVTDTVDYSVAQFHEAFNHMLPVLAKVHQGFFGDILEDTFDKDQVIRIQAESRQKRVLVNVQQGRDGRKCFSMPIDYNAMFCVVRKRGKDIFGKDVSYRMYMELQSGDSWPFILFNKSAGREARLQDIISTEKLPVKIQFAKKEEITVGNTRTATIRFPEMELVKVFDEIYLLGNFVIEGSFSFPVVAIPLYLSQLRLAEIVGVKGQSAIEFTQYEQVLSDLAHSVKYDPTFGNKDIAQYRPESIQSDAVYPCIEPITYSIIGTFFKAQPPYYEPLDLANQPGNVYDDITPHSDSKQLLDEMKTVQTRERLRMKADQLKPKQAFPIAEKIGENTEEHVYEDITPHSDSPKLMDEIKTIQTRERLRMKADQLKPKQALPVDEKIGDNTEEHVYEDITPHRDSQKLLDEMKTVQTRERIRMKADQLKPKQVAEEIGDNTQEYVYEDITPHRNSQKLLDEIKTVQTRERLRMKADQLKPNQAMPVAGKKGDNAQAYKQGIPKRKLPMSPPEQPLTIASKGPPTLPKKPITKPPELTQYSAGVLSDRADFLGASVVTKLPKSPPEKPFEFVRKGPPTLPKTYITKPCELTKYSTGVFKENDTIDTDSRYENMKIPRERIHPTIQATVKSIETESKITIPQQKVKVETSGAQVNVETNEGKSAATDRCNITEKIGVNTQNYKPVIPKRIARNESDRADFRGASVVSTLPKSPPEKHLEIARKGPPTLPKRNITKPCEQTKYSTGVFKENHTIDIDSGYENMKIPRGRIHPTIQATVKTIDTESKITVAQKKVKTETSGAQVNVDTNEGQSAATDGSDPTKGKGQLVPETIVVYKLTIADVCYWMKRLKLEKYTEKFQKQMIDGVLLTSLDVTILKDDFGMSAVEALRLMSFSRDGHVPK